MLTIVSFLAYLPHSKHLHIATAAVNVWFGRTRARGRLEPLRFDEQGDEEDLRFGAGTVPDLTWKQMLDTFSCTECGRCQDACPAFATGKALSPKLLIMGLRDQVFEQGAKLLEAQRAGEQLEPPPLVPNAVTDEVVWDCVTCGACVQACPVSIEHVDHIVDLRRHLVMVESSFPPRPSRCCATSSARRTRGASAQSERADWAAELGVRVLAPGDPPPEVLYWVGCAGRSTSGRAAARSRRRSCFGRPAWTSRSSARARAAPAIRRGGWATSTSSRRPPSATSPRSTRRA